MEYRVDKIRVSVRASDANLLVTSAAVQAPPISAMADVETREEPTTLADYAVSRRDS